MKSYSKSARRKSKKANSVAQLHESFERQSHVPIAVEEDPQKAAIRARAIQVGEKPTTHLLDPMLETQAGMALWVGVKDLEERRALHELFADYDRAMSLYHSRCLGHKRFPAVSKMEFMPERLEASASDYVDLRTVEEKADAAKKRMKEMDDLVDRLHIWQRMIIRGVSYHKETLVLEGELTGAGMSFIAALRQMAKEK